MPTMLVTGIKSSGFLESPLFKRIDGVPGKVYTEKNTGDAGLACHSVVGEESKFQDGIPNRFLDESMVSPGRYTESAAASCMFILRKEMPHVQMYPITASTWTSGSRGANTSTWAMEAEGGGYGNYSEPLTEHQIQGFLTIARAWERHKVRKLALIKTVRAHWMLARDFGSAATACESGRYAKAWARLAQEDTVDPEIDAAIKRLSTSVSALIKHDSDFNSVMVKRMQIRAIAEGTDEKGFDLLMKAWATLHKAGHIKE